MDFIARNPQQLGQILRGRRKSQKKTQQQAAGRVGLLPKTVSGLEISPERSTIESLFRLLSALELEVILRPKESKTESQPEW